MKYEVCIPGTTNCSNVTGKDILKAYSLHDVLSEFYSKKAQVLGLVRDIGCVYVWVVFCNFGGFYT